MIMKQWTEQDLTLFYYDELPPQSRQALIDDMTQDEKLVQQYAKLCEFLDTQLTFEVPEPSEQLNQRIMASIHQQVEQDLLEKAVAHNNQSQPNFWQRWQLSRVLGFAIPLSFVAVGTFFLGRLSVDTETVIASNPPTQSAEQVDKFDSQRVLMSKLRNHLQSTDRLFTQVSNSDVSNVTQFEQRRQMIADMVALNRIYRRIAEANEDKQLAEMLGQMEQILLSLKNAPSSQDEKGWNNLRSRIDDTDLLFKLRVTEKTLQTI